MEKDLLVYLLEIELALKKQDFDLALVLYEEIENNWESLIANLNIKKTKDILNLINYINSLLEETTKKLKKEYNYLQVRQKYSKY